MTYYYYYKMNRFNIDSFATYENERFSNESSDFQTNMKIFIPTIAKDDFLVNFWKGSPNLQIMEREITDIDTEVNNFTKNKETVSEYEFLFSLKQKINKTLKSLKDLIKERQEGRTEIEKSCNSLITLINYLKSNGALSTTDPKDIEFNKNWKNDVIIFEDKITGYMRYVMAKIDTEITKISYVLQKYELLYEKITSIMFKINQEIYQVHFKDKMPKSNIFCTICLTNNSTHACVPCGHIFCKGCIDSIKDKCASCRTKIEKTIKLFNLEELNASTGEVLENTTTSEATPQPVFMQSIAQLNTQSNTEASIINLVSHFNAQNITQLTPLEIAEINPNTQATPQANATASIMQLLSQHNAQNITQLTLSEIGEIYVENPSAASVQNSSA